MAQGWRLFRISDNYHLWALTYIIPKKNALSSLAMKFALSIEWDERLSRYGIGEGGSTVKVSVPLAHKPKNIHQIRQTDPQEIPGDQPHEKRPRLTVRRDPP